MNDLNADFGCMGAHNGIADQRVSLGVRIKGATVYFVPEADNELSGFDINVLEDPVSRGQAG